MEFKKTKRPTTKDNDEMNDNPVAKKRRLNNHNDNNNNDIFFIEKTRIEPMRVDDF